MADNATVSQSVQIGLEATWGTKVPATKILKSMMVDLDPSLETDPFFPNGNVVPSSNAVIRETVEGDISGVLTYTEILYLYTMLFGPTTPTLVATSTGAYDWEWEIMGNDLLVPKSATIEKGSSVYAVDVPGVTLTGFNIGWSRTDRIEVGASLIGQKLEKGNAMTNIAVAPTVPIVRVLPQQISFYTADTFAGLDAATAMARAFEAGIDFSSMFSGVWPMNRATPNMDGVVPTQMESESSALLMVNAASLAFLDTAQAGDRVYTRVEAVGPEIETGFNYEHVVDLTTEVKDLDTFDDHDGIYAIPWTFQPVDDGTNPFLKIRVRTSLSAL